MGDKVKIIVAGIGGVGGYFGGRLAKKYYQSDKIEIYFIARGEHLQQIQQKGLTIKSHEEEFVVHPAMATDKPAEIGTADYIILCTKGYDLDKIVTQLKPCIAAHTIILPLLNGVDNVDKLKSLLPETGILTSCVYVVSRLEGPGLIHNTGNIEKIYFGSTDISKEKMLALEKIFTEAAVDAILTDDIISVIWDKYIFISPLATTTSFFDSTIGQIVEDPVKLDFIGRLIEEVKHIAKAKNISFDKDITEKVIARLHSLPYHNTSSMHSDYRSKKGSTELSSLTEYVIKEGIRLGIETPAYINAYSSLLKKQAETA